MGFRSFVKKIGSKKNDLKKTIMVGDSEVDANSAHNANLPFVLVKDGYTEKSEKEINPDFLETFTFDSPNQYIMTETDEFSAVCPFSGLPDLAYVKIDYSQEGTQLSLLVRDRVLDCKIVNSPFYREGTLKK